MKRHDGVEKEEEGTTLLFIFFKTALFHYMDASWFIEAVSWSCLHHCLQPFALVNMW